MSDRLTIGYFTSLYARASDTFVRNEVRLLRDLGHTVFTYSVRRPEASQLVDERVRREYDGTFYILPDHAAALPFALLGGLLRRPARFLKTLRLAWRTGMKGLRARAWTLAYLAEALVLARRMERDGVEHLHNHLGESSATVAMLAGCYSGIPYSVAIHGPYIFRAPEFQALGEKITRSSFTTCITDFTRSQCMIQVPHAQWSKLHIVRCGPDEAFLEGDVPPLPAAPRLVWVGRVCEEKGVPLVIDAAEALAETGADFELVMVGDGPLRTELEASLPARGLTDKVRFAGWASSAEVREHIVQSRAMVLPSFAEGLPVVIMEALALGRPVISTYIAGIPELVETGANGWMVPAGSIDALVDAMRDCVAADDAELQRLGREGRRRVQERHDLHEQVRTLERLIRTSARGPAPASMQAGPDVLAA